MSRDNRPVGPFGATLLGLAAVAGVLLAVHGWSSRQLPAALGSVGGGPVPAASTAPSPRQAGPHPAGSAPGPTSSPASPTPGPLLSSQQYARYAFQVWPGTMSSAARTAMTGLTISVRQKPAGLEVTAGVTGQSPAAPVLYPGGAHVYVIEAALGDDSGNSDFNLGDDGIVVTDARGRILQ